MYYSIFVLFNLLLNLLISFYYQLYFSRNLVVTTQNIPDYRYFVRFVRRFLHTSGTGS